MRQNETGELMDEMKNFGAIFGAINNPYSKAALEHAEKYYEFIRNNKTDVYKIAENTQFTLEQIIMVKNFLFIDEHNLEGEIKRFDSSFEIAQSWQRLAYMPKDIQLHDITLIKHELKEMELMNKGFSQQEAHDKTEVEFGYNYTLESNLYYEHLREKNKNQDFDFDLNGGAIRRHGRTH